MTLEFFRKCSRITPPSAPMTRFQLEKLRNLIMLYFIFCIFQLPWSAFCRNSILSVEQKGSEFFKDSSRNSGNQSASAIEVKFRNSAGLLRSNLCQIIRNNVNLCFRIRYFSKVDQFPKKDQ